MMKNKTELRKEILARRNALSKEERSEKSRVIAKRVIALEEFQKSNKILLYAPIKSEVETQAIYQEAKRLGKAIYYPRVLGDRMEFYLVDDATEFDTSRFGICEPIPESTIAFEPSETDVIFVLMPGAVFDIEGNRIGYGGGYYDKYLQWLESVVPAQNVYKVAVAYECQIVEVGVIEKEPHDMKAEYVATEESITLSNSYRYFENRDCRFYPCHDMEHINCMFCYCPLYHMEHCPGRPKFFERNGNRVKDCSACAFPHEKGNYDMVMLCLSKNDVI